tara:strand:+ start:1692 stop:2801 length:1110 start_codon:yes stop_codon:yes gene_type:complete
MKFSEIGPLVHGVTKQDPASRPEARFDYIDLSSINRFSKAIAGPINLPTVEAPSRARQLVQTGDVLVSTVRPNLNAVAKVPLELDGATVSTGFTVLRAKADQLDPAYLLHWVRSDRFVKEMVGLATGASYPAVTDKIVKKSLIPLVPLEEQRRIASILDAADELRTKRQQAINQLDTLTQAIFNDMFGDPQTNPLSWPTVELGDVCEVRRGTMITEKETTPGEVPVIAGGMKPSYYHSTSNRSQAVTTVSASGANAGHIGYWDVPIWASDCTTVEPDDSGSVAGRFMFHQLKAMETRIQATLRRGAAQPHVYAKDIADLEVFLPPVADQKRFGEIVSAFGSKRAVLVDHLDTFDSLFASLQQRAFRGDL